MQGTREEIRPGVKIISGSILSLFSLKFLLWTSEKSPGSEEILLFPTLFVKPECMYISFNFVIGSIFFKEINSTQFKVHYSIKFAIHLYHPWRMIFHHFRCYFPIMLSGVGWGLLISDINFSLIVGNTLIATSMP